MSNLSRRELFKGILSSGILASGLGLTSCLSPQELEGMKVFWIHWEGAPLRTLFDLWIDPYGLHSDIRPPFPHKEYKLRNKKLSLPETWFENERPSSLLSHFVGIRGISTKSPHLKQCRMEWFSKELLQSIKKAEEESENGHKEKLLLWSSPNENLRYSYRELLGQERELKSSSAHPLSFFKDWINILKSGSESQVHVAITNRFSDNHYFENLSEITPTDLNLLKEYYRRLISELESLKDELKKRKIFDKTLILVTSDRARILTDQGTSLKSETLWQGLNIGLFSGALTGPVTLGHIAEEHPNYKESYPGTWGHGLENWRPADVHQLLADLSWSTGYTRAKKWSSPNPWIDLKPFHHLSIKKGPGQIINT